MLTVPTAQETFGSMMKDQISPGLRTLGFKGSGQAFTLPDDGHFAQVGFQKSTYSDSTAVRFTINVSVIPFDAWAEARLRKPYLPAKPSPSVLYGSPFWQKRLGQLLPGGEDTWWLVHAGQDTTSVANEVVTAISTYVLPEMREQLDRA